MEKKLGYSRFSNEKGQPGYLDLGSSHSLEVNKNHFNHFSAKGIYWRGRAFILHKEAWVAAVPGILLGGSRARYF